MPPETQPQPTFEITHETSPTERLITGFSSFGLAGLTAVDFLVNQLELTETGHISVDTLPAITPFENGTPRHHTRLFSRGDLDLTILVNELYIPIEVVDSFAKAILEWTEENAVREVTILSGIPVPHGPEEHKVFYVATEDYQDDQLAESEIPGMGGGFLNGVNASLIGRGMDSALRVGVFITPVHAQVPDAEAAIRLVEVTQERYGLDIDTSDLEEFAGEVEQYYQDLEERVRALEETREPEDQMYM
jgi:uncharacterized protein